MHRRLSSSKIELQIAERNSLKNSILQFVFNVLLSQNSSQSNINYFKCTVCDSEYSDNDSMPHGWGELIILFRLLLLKVNANDRYSRYASLQLVINA